MKTRQSNIVTTKEAIDALQTEQRFIFDELRSIHDRRIAIFRVLVSAIAGLITYLIAGIVFYMKAVAESLPVPAIIGYSYSIIGLFLTLALYFVVHNLYYHIGPSKKHSVRYWKAIHAIREKIKSLSDDLRDGMILPDSLNHPSRPRLSHRWDMGALIYPLYHLLFYGIMIIFLIPFFAVDDRDGLRIPVYGSKPFLDASIALLPLLILKLAIGCRAMRKYWENIAMARNISNINIFPKERFFYDNTLEENEFAPDDPYMGRTGHRGVLRTFLWWVHVILTTFSLFFTLSYFLGDYDVYGASTWIPIPAPFIVSILIITSIIVEVAYLKSYNIFPVSIEVTEGRISLTIKR